MPCLSPPTVQALLDAELDHARRVEALAHAASCAECGPKVCPLKPSDVLGPCQVLKPLAPGTFGLRFVARDTRNDGRVELESLRVGKQWEQVAVRHRFLVTQSATGLAKVVDVFDEKGVGAIERELDEGPVFEEWVGQQPRSAAQVVAAWVDVGRALDAAHASGVTHGALSLDAVRFDAAGRPRLSGFGASGPVDLPPEGKTPSKAADQFGYAASLLRALTSSTPSEVQLAERFGVVRSRLARRAVQALERALAPAPERRFDHLSDLLEALRPSPLFKVVGGVAALAVLAVVVAAYLSTRPPPCAGSNEPLEKVWNDSRRSELRKAYFRSKDPWATTALDRAVVAINGWARNWSDQSKRLCLAAEAARPGSTEVKPADQQACLAGQTEALDALLGEVTDSEDRALERTPLLWELLGDPRACERPPAAPTEAEQQLRHKLVAFEAALLLGRPGATKEAAEKIVPTARGSASVPLASDAARLYGEALAGAGELKDATRWLEDARALGGAVPSKAGLAAAAETWALLRADGGDLDAARSALVAAEAAATAAPDDALLAARTQQAHAGLHVRDGNFGEARPAAEAMGAAFEKALRPAAEAVAYGELAQLASRARRSADARAWQISSCRAWMRLVPEDHPVMARCRLEWSALSLERGEPVDALAAIEPAVAVRKLLWRVPNENAVQLFLAQARALGALDRHKDAVAAAERARDEADELGTTPQAIASVLPVLGLEHAAAGDFEHALAETQAAVGAAQATHRPLGLPLLTLAKVDLLAGRPADALGVLDQIDATTVPKGELLACRGAAQLMMKKNADALRTLQDAIAADEAAAREAGYDVLPAEHLTWLARAQLAANDPNGADATAQHALEQLGLFPDARVSAWAHLVRAAALTATKRPEPAKEHLAAATEQMHHVSSAFGPELLDLLHSLEQK